MKHNYGMKGRMTKRGAVKRGVKKYRGTKRSRSVVASPMHAPTAKRGMKAY